MECDLTCKEDFLYSSLNQSTTSIFTSKIGLKTRQEHKKDVIRSFLKLHLPAKRLLANEDDMSQRYVPLNNSSHWRFSLIKHKGKSKKIKNREQRRKIFDISKKAQSYDRYLPLHHMWTQYMEQIISSNCSPRNIQTSCHKVMKADLHGCILTVHRSKCPSYVGLQGIVLQETRNTIKILTQNNTVKSIPKIKTEFSFELNNHIFTIHGNHFRIKTGERSSRKFKSRSTIDL